MPMIFFQMYTTIGVMLVFLGIAIRYREQAQKLTIQNKLLEQLAWSDLLTQLPNRRRIYDLLCTHMQLAKLGEQPLCVVLFDIDHFKQINDTFGHATGDRVLVQVSQIMRDHMRAIDYVGRWGGEEFLLLLPHTRLADATRAVERLRTVLGTYPILPDQPVTASFGVVMYHAEDTIDTLLHRVDQALYVAKVAGRNRISVQISTPQTHHKEYEAHTIGQPLSDERA